MIVSGMFWCGAPGEAIDEVIQGRVLLLSSDTLITKLREVVSRPKFSDRIRRLDKTVDELMTDYANLVHLVQPASIGATMLRDSEDIAVLACAVGGQAEYIVSGDRHLIELQSYENMPILKVSEFLQRIRT